MYGDNNAKVIGAKLNVHDIDRLKEHLNRTGEPRSDFIRRAILGLLDRESEITVSEAA